MNTEIAGLADIAPDYDSMPYWRGCAERRLLIARCQSCGHWIHYPRQTCPKCWSEAVEVEEVAGNGTIYTYVVFDHPDPYVFARIELTECPGVIIMAPICDCSPSEVAIGMAVQLMWIDKNGLPVPAFRLVSGALEDDPIVAP